MDKLRFTDSNMVVQMYYIDPTFIFGKGFTKMSNK